MSSQSYTPTSLYDLTGRIALVTGGGTGIGWMITRGLAAAGAKVYIAGRRLEVVQKVADSWAQENAGLGLGEIVPIQIDVTDKKSILAAKEIIQEKEGRLHILINNAGQVGQISQFLKDPSAPECATAESLGSALFAHESFEGWSSHFSVNGASIFFVTNAFLGLLAKGGEEVPGYWSSVVNITSISGVIKVAQGHFCYNAVKAAASHLTKMFATELAIRGIPVRVNAIAPGTYESEMTHATITSEMIDKIGLGLVSLPAKRPGKVEEMAGTVLYLVSRTGGFTNGQEIVVDGGYVAVNPATV